MPQDLLTGFATLMRAADLSNPSIVSYAEEIDTANGEELLLHAFRNIRDAAVKEAILAVVLSISKRSDSALS